MFYIYILFTPPKKKINKKDFEEDEEAERARLALAFAEDDEEEDVSVSFLKQLKPYPK